MALAPSAFILFNILDILLSVDSPLYFSGYTNIGSFGIEGRSSQIFSNGVKSEIRENSLSSK